MMHAPLVRTSFGKVITASSMTRSVSQKCGYAFGGHCLPSYFINFTKDTNTGSSAINNQTQFLFDSEK